MLIKKMFLIFSFLISSFNLQAMIVEENFFRVAPYTLKHPNGSLLLSFQTNSDVEMSLEEDGIEKKYSSFKNQVQYKIELSKVSCGKAVEIKLIEKETRNTVYQNIISAIPCDSFKTNQAFVFGFISDTQQFKERHEQIAKTIAFHHTVEPLQFLINGGDIVQNGFVESEWINYFLGGKLYLNDIPQIAAIGNHDYRGAHGDLIPKYFNQYLRWPGADIYGNLFFDFKEVQLLILNSNFSRLDHDAETFTWNWIEEKLALAAKINKPIIIATHFPVYSSSLNRFTTLSIMKMRSKLVPLVEKYRPAIVLSGHTHMYERSLKNGINYLVAGPAGGKANHPTFSNKYKTFMDADALTFTKLKLLQNVLTIETYNQDNLLIDQLALDLNKR
jgi:hypothetical protein